jgi:hypothetical protein
MIWIENNNMGRIKLKKIILTMAAAVLLSSMVAMAQPMSPMMMAEKLGLSDQQIEQIRSLRMQYEKTMIQKRADLGLAQLELRETMMNLKLDEKAALSKQERISSIRGDIARTRLQQKLDVFKVLTDDQKATWRKMRLDMGPGGPHKRGHFGRGQGMMSPDGPMGRMMGREGKQPWMGHGMQQQDENQKSDDKK